MLQQLQFIIGWYLFGKDLLEKLLSDFLFSIFGKEIRDLYSRYALWCIKNLHDSIRKISIFATPDEHNLPLTGKI